MTDAVAEPPAAQIDGDRSLVVEFDPLLVGVAKRLPGPRRIELHAHHDIGTPRAGLVDFDGEAVEIFGAHSDDIGHGTACASLIHSFAPEASLTSVKVVSKGLSGARWVRDVCCRGSWLEFSGGSLGRASHRWKTLTKQRNLSKSRMETRLGATPPPTSYYAWVMPGRSADSSALELLWWLDAEVISEWFLKNA